VVLIIAKQEFKKMDAKLLYPEYQKEKEEQDDGYFYGSGDYQPIIDAIGEVIIQVDEGEYQGDTSVLYRNGKRYGYLTFSWGSCPGCDSFQACRSISEIQELIDRLQSDVEWFISKEECLKHFQELRGEAGYSWHEYTIEQFVEKAIEHLSRD
jgi:hypothetical protein